MPSIGSRRCSMPGRIRPTVPALKRIGVLTAMPGAVSVAP